MNGVRLYLKEHDGRILPCLEDGTIIAGLTRAQINNSSHDITETVITFYPAGLIKEDGEIITGPDKGFLS